MASLFKKSKDKIKSGESVVGKIIYIFLLFAPLFSIITTCFYVMFNKNAFESYYGETINEKEYTQITNINQLNINDDYLLMNNYLNGNNPNNSNNQRLYCEIKSVEIAPNSTDITNTKSIGFYGTTSSLTTYFYNENNELLTSVSGATEYRLIIKYVNNNFQTNNKTLEYANILYKINYNKYSYLDNVFDYSLYKVEQNNVFNWPKTTAMYQVLHTTCNGLGITNTFTPMLLAYWLIISIIYFIYDIGLMLVWIMHRKIHELQENI